MIEKQESYSRIELLETGHVQLRLTTKITEDGNVLSEGHHRSVVTPLDDISHLPADLQSTITAFWANGHKAEWEAKAQAETQAEEVANDSDVSELEGQLDEAEALIADAEEKLQA